ncbi:hypothetical protein KC367_g1301 [Hortaea werneckii]|uniref:Biogenesis of lysosome-related organelles complex 1 subunit KXD1 n=2 Tax=Hortaea werneckii TaxID=91943 RepID=A0A3M7GEF4_HORWE|nr:hypothetical protein KC358_g18395 [Hortaea werneckii]OTA34808.1 hypothetical protein BTJ68_05354 [Hortaea werneckii EXF-2000]KAI6816566.1 hypothetical protein KC350_g10753 [Hortaea werneckii]KAI6820119.1 hypothetical protein KC358_g9541 [Hortaea werneckii]KAI6839406.1 hypothetical protein KC342_g3493 [Hortaea werneckii]
MSTAYYQYQPTGTLPVSVPGKKPQQGYLPRHARNTSAYSQLSVSPPERPESVSTSGAGLYSSASSSYADSEYESSTAGATSVDLLDYMNDRLSQTYNPLPMDHSLAKQTQMSGELNAKNRELQALQAQARARLAKTRANFAEGMKAAKDVQRDLEWTQKKVHALNARAARKHPEQYRAASERYPAPVDC